MATKQDHDQSEVHAGLRQEIQRVNSLLFEDQTSSIIQYMAVLFAGAAVAALKAPEAFVVIPLFWNLWILHMQVKHITTLKLAAYARYLEEKANSLLSEPIFRYQAVLTQRTDRDRPHIFNAFYSYFFLLNLSSWIVAIYILIKYQYLILAGLSAAICVLTWASALITARKRKYYWSRALKQLGVSSV